MWGEKCTDNGSLPCSAPTCSDLHNQSPFKAVRCEQAGRDIGRAGKRGGPITVLLVLGGVGGSGGALLRLSVQHESGVFRDQKGYNQKV